MFGQCRNNDIEQTVQKAEELLCSVNNTKERNQIGANAMQVFSWLFVHPGAWRLL